MTRTSSSTALTNLDRTVRRRTLSPRVGQGPLFSESPSLTLKPSYLWAEYDPSDRDEALLSTPLLQVEDVDELHGQPSVLLVRNKLSNSDCNPYSAEPFHQKLLSLDDGTDRDILESVPLTPRPDLSARTETASSITTRVSEIPRLPTPDFSSPRLGVFDFFRSGLNARSDKAGKSDSQSVDGRATPMISRTRQQSVLSAVSSPLRMIQSISIPSVSVSEKAGRLKSCFMTINSEERAASDLEVKRPLQARSDSDSSSASSGSATAVSISSSADSSGRSSLVSEFPRSEKFTQKWPEPKFMKHLKRSRLKPDKSQYDKLALGPEQLVALSDAEIGLGLERIGQWSRPKWCLILSVLTVLGYSVAALTYSVVTWYQSKCPRRDGLIIIHSSTHLAWDHADVMLVADSDVLILITLCSILMLTSALVGLTGTLLNSRPILAVYAILLWPALISLLTVGYMSYKRSVFALDRKLNLAWSQWYTDIGRQVIQDSLKCCGFYDSVHEAVVTRRCYPRTPLPGCKGPLLRFERNNLTTLWTLAFSFLPLHLINIFVALLCANHVTDTFGKGLMPKKYRLRVEDVRSNAHSLLMHFADGSKPPPIARAGSSTSYFREDKVS